MREGTGIGFNETLGFKVEMLLHPLTPLACHDVFLDITDETWPVITA